MPRPDSLSGTSIKLWHDDVRRPPDDSWTWARTNEEARRVLSGHAVAEVSLDHDLGAHDVDPDQPGAIYVKGDGEETGLDLVRWMCEHACVPPFVVIHSWNPVGARSMALALADHGHPSITAPFEV